MWYFKGYTVFYILYIKCHFRFAFITHKAFIFYALSILSMGSVAYRSGAKKAGKGKYKTQVQNTPADFLNNPTLFMLVKVFVQLKVVPHPLYRLLICRHVYGCFNIRFNLLASA